MAARKKNDEAQAPPATLTTVSALRPSRGPVDAPRKRHRKPLPDEPVNVRMGEPRGKHMGHKSAKHTPRS